jgi:hypothetical protein
MTLPTWFCFAPWLLACLGSGAARAQEQATTLWAGTQRAAVVVRATAQWATDPAPEWRRIEFRSDEVLRGQIPATFTLQEPAGACCGRSLFALEPGTSCLLFLQRTGATWHPFGGARYVLEDTPELVAHVRALLQASTPTALAAVLVAGLAATEPRIAADAAHALAVQPTLPLQRSDLEAVQRCFGTALATASSIAPSLLEVLVARADTSLLDDLLPRYLGEPRDDCARLLRSALLRQPPEQLLARLPLHAGDDERHGLRGAELCAELPAYEGTAGLRALLGRTRAPRVQLRAAEALLTFGVGPASLRYQLPPAVLALAERRTASLPQFRALPNGRR